MPSSPLLEQGMPREKFEFTDPATASDSETNLTTMSNGKSGGCHVSGAMGAVLALLAILIAVGVGVMVHLANGGQDVTCTFGSSAVQASQGAATSAAVMQECQDLAAQGDTGVCSHCPALITSVQPTTPTSAAPTTPPQVRDVRLPLDLTPLHYDVRLQPYLYNRQPETFNFKGFVRLRVNVTSATNNITLHVNVLTVDEASIRFRGVPPNRVDPFVSSVGYDTDRQFIIISLSRNMQVGKEYEVEMNFTSPLKDDLKGLYYSTYTRNGEKVYIATTQLQPTDARKTFPCMDEPALKASFNITLVRPDNLISLSNMPIVDQSETWTEAGITWVADKYHETPRMSTYLLAFIICDFTYKQNKTKFDVEYRAYAIPESIDEVDYALKTGIQIIEYFEDFFGVEYPLPKQDMIAIPDFAAGAMENWGLITYRETAMLFKDGVSNERNRERVAIVVSHELAHMWFGDLVSPSWWDDLWLNEGFASFVEYLGVDHVHPDWNMFAKFALSEQQRAFSFDGLISSHPLYVPVGHPDEINEIFDAISYSKGASIIRMMRHYLGFETFRLGMKRYLTEKQFDAAFHDDLWNALTEQAVSEGKDINVKEVMDTWTLQMNYPVVTVTRDFNDRGVVHVVQERYLVDMEATDPGKYNSTFGYRWTIPLTFTSQKTMNFDQNETHVHWMYHTEESKNIDLGASNLPDAGNPDGWILANIGQNGYYRVNYQTGNWKNLAKQLKDNHQVIDVINRAQIINDAWNLAKSGTLNLDIPLAATEYLNKEREYVPWSAAVGDLSYVSTMLSLTPLNGHWTSFMKNLLQEPYDAYGLDNTGASHSDSYARSLLAGQACKYGIQGCLDASSQQFASWMAAPMANSIDPNLKTVVYCYGIQEGAWDEWSFVLEMYKNETVATEKANLLYALSCASKPWILNNYLYLILEEDTPIRKQDALSVIDYVSGEVVGRPLAWNFFRANYAVLKERFGASFFAWTRTIGSVTSAFNSQFELDQISAFESDNAGQLGTGERAFQQAREKTQTNIKWMATNQGVLEGYLGA